MVHVMEWGKYKHYSLEELMWFDQPYVLRIERASDSDHPQVQHIRRLREIASHKPIVVPCTGDVIFGSGCRKSPRVLSVPGRGGLIRVREARFLCDDPACNQVVVAKAGVDCLRYEISFDGIERFLDIRPARYQVYAFVRKLAQAWGIIGESGRLTRPKMVRFFQQEREDHK